MSEPIDDSTQQDRQERPRDPDNDPPHSRVFIVCGKTTTEEELDPEFRALGSLQYLRIVRDKTTMESKGIAYAKYEKASAAALAIEHLNGKKLSEEQPALKVMVADAKGSQSSKYPSKEPEDTPPRSRLFVVCAKEFSEDDLTERFKVYGDLEYCKLIKDKQTGESKGYAYVKYFKASHAAAAVEEVSQTVEPGVKLKALVADPKSKSRGAAADMSMPNVGYSSMSMPVSYPFGADLNPMSGYSMPPYGVSGGGGGGGVPRQRLFVVCHKSVTQDQLSRLFSRYPGMEYCDLKRNKQTDESKGFAYINYSTPQAAMMAKEQMDGFDFPHNSGSVLKVMFAEPLGVKGGAPSEHPSISAASSSPSMQVRDTFANMMTYPSMGYPAPSHIPTSMSPTDPTKSTDRNYPEGSRLFIVLSKALPDYILQDVFSRFGPLEYVRLQKDKNYGYAKYTTSSVAQYAMQYLNNTDIHGQRIRIQLANPPSGDSSRKRQRV